MGIYLNFDSSGIINNVSAWGPARGDLALHTKPRWHKNKSGVPGVKTDTGDEESPADDEAVVCARCGHGITGRSAACEIEGIHAHTQVNPGGYIWNFRCFKTAPGVRPVGSPSTEFAWFHGCAWQITHCTGCDLHLGWQFTGAQAFHGLITERIVSRH